MHTATAYRHILRWGRLSFTDFQSRYLLLYDADIDKSQFGVYHQTRVFLQFLPSQENSVSDSIEHKRTKSKDCASSFIFLLIQWLYEIPTSTKVQLRTLVFSTELSSLLSNILFQVFSYSQFCRNNHWGII